MTQLTTTGFLAVTNFLQHLRTVATNLDSSNRTQLQYNKVRQLCNCQMFDYTSLAKGNGVFISTCFKFENVNKKSGNQRLYA